MGVDLSERKARRSADHPAAIGHLIQVVLRIEKTFTMAIEKTIYTARAKAMGGRAGTAKSEDGQINLKLDRPVDMGGRWMAPTRNNCLSQATRLVLLEP